MTKDIVVGRRGGGGGGRGIVLERPAPGGASPPAESSVLVSGAGSLGVDGTYTPRGTQGGKTYYNLIGQPDAPSVSSIVWDTAQWIITSSGGDPLYVGVEEVDSPWEVSSWDADSGDPPAPTVTEA